MKHTLLILASVASIVSFACSRAQWQEDRGNGAVAQDTTAPKPNPETPINPGAPPKTEPVPAPTPTHRPPQVFTDCQSQTLSVEVDTTKTQDNLKDFWTTTARYPLIRVTQAAKTKKRVTFFLNASDSAFHACKDQTCADQAGWALIQNDILDLNGMTMQCVGQAPPPQTPTPFAPDTGNGRG